jgi:hypothetical protein
MRSILLTHYIYIYTLKYPKRGYMVRVELKVLFVEIKLGLRFSGKVLS